MGLLTVRLFTGLAIPPAVVTRICDVTRPLKAQARIQWSPPENYHITTKFIGEWPAERLKSIVGAIRDVPKPGPLEIEITGVGLFSPQRSKRLLSAGVRAPEPLIRFANDTDAALAAVGIPAETRAYTPHVTLARVKSPAALEPIRESIAELELVEFGRFEATIFHLYLSRPAPGGSLYEKLAAFPL